MGLPPVSWRIRRLARASQDGSHGHRPGRRAAEQTLFVLTQGEPAPEPCGLLKVTDCRRGDVGFLTGSGRRAGMRPPPGGPPRRPRRGYHIPRAGPTGVACGSLADPGALSRVFGRYGARASPSGVEAHPERLVIGAKHEHLATQHRVSSRTDQWDFSNRRVSISRRSHACRSLHKVS